jgi:predicted DsbA family dithiol-disulfide isomerase
MAESSLDMARQTVAMDVEWRAYELRPAGSPPPDPAYMKMVESSWPRVQAMGEEFGVEMKTYRLGVNTRSAHRALKIVERLAPEQAHAYNIALFRAHFTEGRDIADDETLVALAEECGVDGAALREALAAGEALTEVHEEERAARELQITGVPAFIFADKYLLTGVRPTEQIVQIVQQIQQMGSDG